ncbi:MAG: class I SAM-dependent methyltransferase [Chloroflexota bacterium]|nr:MAG: class I SAM-dependent methyltransferase [Chloroflexota bacterium]
MQQLIESDPFADALEQFYETGSAHLDLLRDDGYHNIEDVGWYFTTFPDFWTIEKAALKFARGRVLDAGCGAGRMALYLQRKGLRVTAVDSSPRVAALASARGVRDVRVASACERLPFKRAEFETVILFGNNLGICGSRAGLEKMLREFARVTNKSARILATTRAPGMFNPKHRAYWAQRLKRGQAFGVVRLRLKFGMSEREIDWFWIAPAALMELAWQCGWRVAEIFGDGRAEDGYAVMLEKR